MGDNQRVPNVTDERLCWLAVRDHVDKRSRKLGFFGWFSVLASARAGGGGPTSTGLGGDVRRSAMSDRKMDYALAVDEAAERLSAEERRHLRATGEVPPWFVDEVERRAAAIRG
ncbi:hypothetical protein K7472_18400 [Streptomyces sp. PTM05]|uniref:Uncharacterized protein n=1 Tax=Streptantibioticus parmotrematis TaxID=2873249 RepID=A0ABS7QUE3_9ACTN|nr:hypothetical protein [Streptantibioticus parmotrematis]MBY8886822.1 hypothetical protein [Streptantibioticus parmotrematis]